MTQVVNPTRLIALLLGCLLVGQSVLPFAAFGASDSRDRSGANEAADILGVRSNVDRILALQATGGVPSEELLWNKAIVLKQLLLGYLEVRQTSDLLDEAIDETYDAIDKQMRTVNRRVALANIANFTTFGVLFNIGAAARLQENFALSHAMTVTGASMSAGLGAVAVALSYTGASTDRGRPNPLAQIFGLDRVTVPLPELVSKYIDASPAGKTQSRKAAMLDLWKTQFGVNESRASREILAGESPKRHKASIRLLNQRLALLFSLNTLAEQFDSELLALLRVIESTSVPTHRQAVTFDNQLGAPGLEAAKLLQVEECAADIIDMNRTRARNGADLQALARDLYVLEKILGAALEVRQAVDRIDQEKHYQFDILLPQLVRARDRVNLLTNTATFTEIGVLKNIAAGNFAGGTNPQAGNEKLIVMNSLIILLSNANLAYQMLHRRKQDSQVNVLANIFKFSATGQNNFSALISSYLEGVPPGSASSINRRQQLLDRWKQAGLLPKEERGAQALASMPSMHNQRVETIELVNKRVQMLFDLKGTVESLDAGLLQLLTAVILPTEKNADSRVDEQLALIKRTMQNALEVRSVSDEIDNQLSREYIAKGAILAARSRGIQYNNILNFTQSGTLGIVSEGLSMKHLETQANTLDLVSGSAVLLLSSAALLQQRMGKRPSKPELNVLAQVLVPGAAAKESLPPSVLQYLNSSPTTNGLTRRESLIERWRKSGVIRTNLRSERNLVKLSASGQTSRKESVQLITDRIVMLHDVNTTVESMDKQLVLALKEGGQPQAFETEHSKSGHGELMPRSIAGPDSLGDIH